MKNGLFYFYILFVVLYGCANPQPPSGGPPDKIPPRITGTEPGNGTTNFKGKSVTIKFDKWLKRENMSENIYVSPRTDIDLDWDGKDLEIQFLKPLLENTTYAITLGTEYTDISGNKPVEAFTLIFSTGSVIDTGVIKGIVVDKDPSGAYVFAYHLDGINPDTLDIRHTRPQYLTQVGSNGTFEIHALKQGKYRVFAVRDQYKDGIYDEGIDAFGAPTGDVAVATDTPFVRMRLGPPIDKTGPQLFNAEALSARMIALNFSESLARTSVSAKSFTLRDSAGIMSADINSAYLSQKSASRVEIITAAALDSTRTWLVTASTDSALAVRDSSGNVIQDTSTRAYFAPVTNPETTVPVIVTSPFRDSTVNIDPADTLSFLFNIGISQESINKSLYFIEMADSHAVAFKTLRLADNDYGIIPGQDLKGNSWYVLGLSAKGITGANGIQMKDTTIRLRFNTADIRTYSSISGTVRDSLGCGGPYVVILSNPDTKKSYKTATDNANRWIFTGMPPGNYNAEVFCDSDRNGRYSFGSAFPFVFGERFMISGNQVNVRARWNTENIILDMNK